MKNTIKTAIVALLALTCSCADFLDIVPDNVATIDNAFSTRASAKKYLFTCYSYLPDFQSTTCNPALLGGDEMICFTTYRTKYNVYPWYICNGVQSPTSPYNNFWEGKNGGTDMYQGIRDCNIFIENACKIPDISDDERNCWIDEAKFLKAYLHFYLIRMYGPIPIKDTNLDIDASIEDVRVYREPLDSCFAYVVRSLDGILNDSHLPDYIINEAAEQGRITNGIVRAVKAEVLMYAASPLFNGNTDYAGFTDNRGLEIFCPNVDDDTRLKRWKAAAAACQDAIVFLEKQGHGLYEYNNPAYTDETNYKLSVRYAFTENWNKEIVWGYTGTRVQHLQLVTIPRGLYASTGTGNCGNLAVPIKIAEQFYTKNGVPIDEDLTWKYADRFNLREAKDEEYPLMKPGYISALLNFDREYRYYADLAFDGCVWFGQGNVSEGTPTYVEAKLNQACANVSNSTYNMTGIWPKKLLNPNTVMSTAGKTTYVDYAFPIITMSSLYLYYAEALNESGADYTEVLPWINMIRQRAGIPDVEVSWENFTNSPNRYKSQSGLRSIIHRERNIEMAFEGQRYWDLRRWKEALSEMNKPITGWTLNQSSAAGYYKERLVLQPNFSVKDYFSPIPNEEIYANGNTLQNYGW